jgi:hypothetical protein
LGQTKGTEEPINTNLETKQNDEKDELNRLYAQCSMLMHLPGNKSYKM